MTGTPRAPVLRYCKACQHLHGWYCRGPQNSIDPVDGEYAETKAHWQRVYGDCGLAAKHFEPKKPWYSFLNTLFRKAQ